jgi:hypothetical protein
MTETIRKVGRFELIEEVLMGVWAVNHNGNMSDWSNDREDFHYLKECDEEEFVEFCKTLDYETYYSP